MKSEAQNSGEAFEGIQSQTNMLNPKLETLNSKQTQMPKAQNRKHFLFEF